MKGVRDMRFTQSHPENTALLLTQNLRRVMEGEFLMSLPFVALCEVGPLFIRVPVQRGLCNR